jgi:hypothetical protein
VAGGSGKPPQLPLFGFSSPGDDEMPAPRKASEWGIPSYTLTERNKQVLLYGQPGTTKGWHYDPTGKNHVSGKSFAPIWMSPEDIVAAAQLTLDEPQAVRDFRGNTVRLREVDRVIWYAETWTATDGSENYKHIYPLNGDDVMRNPRAGDLEVGRYEVPLDRTVLDVP